MKKLALTTLMMVMATITLSAKDIVSFGISMGVNQPHYKIDAAESVSNKMGYQAGVLMRLAIPVISITPELNYVNGRFNVESGESTYKVVNHNLSLPIVAGITLFPFMTLEVGPRITLIDKSVVDGPEDKWKRNGELFDQIGYVAGLRFSFSKIFIVGRYNGQFGKSSSDLFGEVGVHSYSLSIGFKM